MQTYALLPVLQQMQCILCSVYAKLSELLPCMLAEALPEAPQLHDSINTKLVG